MIKMKKNEDLKNRPSQKVMTELENLYKSNQFDYLEGKVRKLIENYPRVSILYNILGIALQKKGDFNESIVNFGQAINIQPNFDQAHNNLGNVLKETGKFEEAITSYQRAIKLNPNYAEAYSNLGNIFRILGKFEEAIATHQQALKLKPNYAEGYSNLGNVLGDLGKFEEAIASYQQALKLNPKYTFFDYNESLIRLTLGEFDVGWKKYEYRFGVKVSVMRYQTDKLWDGNYLDGTLLVWAEQGVGDHILFASMLTDLRKYAKNIILEIDKRLVNLFKRYYEKINFSNIKVINLEKKLVNNFDKHIALGSLGQYLRKTKKSFATTPKKYLISSPVKEKELRNKFFVNKKFKVGISWKSLNEKCQYRNIDLTQMLPILSNPHCDFINLQFGKFDEDLQELQSKHGIKIRTIKEVDNYNNIEDLAALINCLDLVINIQNSNADLAGALGQNTWVMVTKYGVMEWRWAVNEKKSLWYPTTKLFRQEKAGNWNSVVNSINMDLKKLIKRHELNFSKTDKR